MNAKQTLITGAVLGLLGVALGAFGAHALKSTLETNGRVETFELAVRYQFYHALALLFLALWLGSHPNALMGWSGLLWTGGVILFSGSLYVYALTNIKGFAMVTPIGGLLLLGGWVVLLWGAIRVKS
jgi:uncharacterized membrane protein YgdD (TMEM256/DUF423 family)